MSISWAIEAALELWDVLVVDAVRGGCRGRDGERRALHACSLAVNHC